MKITGLALAAALIAGLCPATATAAAGQESAEQQPASCQTLTVAEALEQAEGACVILNAYVVDGLLMDDLLHRYVQPRLYNDPSSSGRQIGLTGWAISAGMKGAAKIRAIGLMRRCDDAGPAGNLLPKAVGEDFCDRQRGYYLAIQQAETLANIPMQRGLRRDGEALGNLRPIPAGAVRHGMLQEFGMVIRALRRDGGAALRSRLPEPKPKRWIAAEALGPDMQIEILGWRTPDWADAESQQSWAAQAAERAEVIACAMDAARAKQNLWPISTRDIGLAADRPYICARLSARGEDHVIAGHDGSTQGGVIIDYSIDENPAVEG